MGNTVLSLLRPFFLDGIASTSAFPSPTMFIGGFSMMMQPMPNGTELVGQLMQMIPNYASLFSKLPGLPTAGQQKNSTVINQSGLSKA